MGEQEGKLLQAGCKKRVNFHYKRKVLIFIKLKNSKRIAVIWGGKMRRIPLKEWLGCSACLGPQGRGVWATYPALSYTRLKMEGNYYEWPAAAVHCPDWSATSTTKRVHHDTQIRNRKEDH